VEGVALEDVLGGISLCRNPKLANIFYRLELIEAYGTGLYKICEAYKEETVQPKFKVTQNVFKVVLPNVNYKGNSTDHENNSRVREAINNNIYSQEAKILQYLKSNSYITRREVEALLDMPPASVIRLLKKMLEKGIIVKEGQARNIRYRRKSKQI